jgi:hypothetical protein
LKLLGKRTGNLTKRGKMAMWDYYGNLP